MRELKVLVACETSGIVRDAFLAEGHDAWSCDILKADTPTNRHLQGDARDVVTWDDWDVLAVMHPPCTRLCASGVRWLSEPPTNPPADATEEQAFAWPDLTREEKLAIMWQHLEQGCDLFSDLWNADVPCIAVENPVVHRHAKERIRNYQKPTCTVQPWQFTDDENSFDNQTKRTCWWTRNLPALTPTGTLDGSTAKDIVHKCPPGANRWKIRSRFFPGMATAVAQQWGEHACRVISA